MHLSVQQFIRELQPDIWKGRVLEVGSLDVNGSAREHISPHADNYLGIDFIDGKGVDRVLDAEKLAETFGDNSFDTVVSTEMLEHAEHWRDCVNNMKRVTRRWLVITTRSPGFGYHEYPNDFWRYTIEDMERIFSDFKITKLLSDPLIHDGRPVPGVFLVAEKLGKPLADLSGIELAGPK